MNDVETALNALRTTAPADVLPTVLAAVAAEEYSLADGPTGPMYVSWSTVGVTACVPRSVVGSDAGFEEHHPGALRKVDAPPRRIARPLQSALETGRLGDLPIDLGALGDFQQAVLAKCAEIPPGEIRPYGWIAREIGNPGAVRAVGTALGHNPIPILIPCHRVVRTDGRIGNYAWGTQMKRDLLAGEGLDPEAIERGAARGVRYVGSDTTGIYCFPTCRHTKRITETHRIEFAGSAAAEDAGYRGCKVCRPAA
jgi:O-6-methylguanine DNA methyltransferase